MSCEPATHAFFLLLLLPHRSQSPANMSSDTSGFTCKHVKRGSGLWAWFIFSWMLLNLMSIRWLETIQFEMERVKSESRAFDELPRK